MYRACGAFHETYAGDMRLLRTRWQWVALAVLLLALLAAPAILPAVWVRFLTGTGIVVIAVLGLQILVGVAGQVSVGQSAFMGVGAYAAAIAAVKLGLPFPLPIVAGAFGTALVGMVFGLPAARIRGFYLALTTLAAQFTFEFAIPRLPASWFGGSAGIQMPAPALFGVSLATTGASYLMVLAFVVVSVLAALFILRSPVGRALIAVRDNDLAAEVTGIDVTAYKIMAFGIASFYAGTAGALLAYENRVVQFEQFTLFASIWYLGMLVAGGMGSVMGAVLGALFLRLIQEVLLMAGPVLATTLPGNRYDIAYPMVDVVSGTAIILFLVYQPRGLAHLYRQAERFFRIWPFPH